MSSLFHVAPNGVEKCRNLNHCVYPHLDSREKAQRLEQKMLADAAEKKAHKAKVEELDRTLRSCSKLIHVFNFDIPDRPRVFAENLDLIKAEYGNQYPVEMHRFTGQHSLRNPKDRATVSVTVSRAPTLNRETASIVPTWIISLKAKLSVVRNFEKVNEKLDLDLTTSTLEDDLDKARKLFRRAVQIGGVKSPEADEKVESMVADLLHMRDVVDSEILGDFAMWEEGRGYFWGKDGVQSSDYDHIIVDVDYNHTAFRGANIKSFFKDDLALGYDPIVQVRVTEHGKFGSYWSMERFTGGDWHVTTMKIDGTVQVSDIPTPDEMRSRVYWDCRTLVHVNADGEPFGADEEVLKRADYAKKLMIDVEEAIEANRERVTAWREEDERNRQARKQQIEERERKKKKKGFLGF